MFCIYKKCITYTCTNGVSDHLFLLNILLIFAFIYSINSDVFTLMHYSLDVECINVNISMPMLQMTIKTDKTKHLINWLDSQSENTFGRTCLHINTHWIPFISRLYTASHDYFQDNTKHIPPSRTPQVRILKPTHRKERKVETAPGAWHGANLATLLYIIGLALLPREPKAKGIFLGTRSMTGSDPALRSNILRAYR